MDYYLDIRLLPTKEMRENVLLNQVYSSFHKRLYDLKSTTIGVSFPEYRLKLGRLLRIHGTREDLERLEEKDWLGKYRDFCKVGTITAVPQNVKYRIVSRVQQNMTEAKLRRLIKRGSISDEEVKKYRIKMYEGGLDNPFVELVSISNGQRHRRFIEFGKLEDVVIEDKFDLFGLSKTATIPWF
ncbi:MAG: type I-F CRISPR-associated endoribonuclease Cas6/Csy4 [Sulfurospirillum sp.]